MKLIILLLAIVFGLGATIKKSAADLKVINARHELNHYKSQPNLLPVVEITATR